MWIKCSLKCRRFDVYRQFNASRRFNMSLSVVFNHSRQKERLRWGNVDSTSYNWSGIITIPRKLYNQDKQKYHSRVGYAMNVPPAPHLSPVPSFFWLRFHDIVIRQEELPCIVVFRLNRWRCYCVYLYIMLGTNDTADRRRWETKLQTLHQFLDAWPCQEACYASKLKPCTTLVLFKQK